MLASVEELVFHVKADQFLFSDRLSARAATLPMAQASLGNPQTRDFTGRWQAAHLKHFSMLYH